MARPDKKEKKDTAKKQKGAKKLSNKWKAYDISSGTLVRKLKSCPKCGDGVHLAQHKDRHSCGKCGYTEFLKKTVATGI
ncbi:MAG: 30S ribosomal protein S27ae [Candidatus Altiarchaeota archaeon]